MRITLENFKHYSNKTFNFDAATTTLIQGDSGSGKSTIVEAICWALYAKTKAASWLAARKSSKVTLKFLWLGNQIIIVRSTVPKAIQLQVANKKYEGDAAQQWINQEFGTHEVWVAGSYCIQEEHHLLARGSAKEKMALIVSLASRGIDVNSYHAKLQPMIDSQLKLVEQATLEHKSSEHYLKSCRKVQVDAEIKTEKAAKEQIVLLEEELKNTKLADRKYQKISSQHQTLEQAISKLPKSNQTVETLSETISLAELDIKQYAAKAIYDRQYANHQSTLKRIEKLTSQLADMPTGTRCSDKVYSLQEIARVAQDEVELERVTAILELFPELDTIHKIKAQLLKQKDEQVAFKNYRRQLDKRTDAENKLASLDLISEPKPVDKTILSKLEKDLRSAIQSLARIEQQLNIPSLECPHCTGLVRLDHHKLVALQDYDPSLLRSQQKEYTIRIAELEAKVKEQNQLVSNYKRAIDNYKRQQLVVQSLETIINTELIVAEKPKELDTLALSSIKSIPVIKTSSLAMQANNDYWKHKELTEELASLGSLSFVDNFEHVFSFKSSKSAQEAITSAKKQLSLLAQRTEYQKQLASLPSLPKDVSSDILDIEKEIKYFEHLTRFLNAQEKVNKTAKSLDHASRKLARLTRFREIIINSEHQVYKNMTTTINSHLATIIQAMFREPIVVRLETFKELKTNHRIKPEVNLSIDFKGYTNIQYNEMSPGQRRRISLGLTLVFGTLLATPVLILDEVMSAISPKDRKMVMKVMQDYIKDKNMTVIVLDHYVFDDTWYQQHIVL